MKISKKVENFSLCLVSVLFITYSFFFIYRSSFISPLDSKRYFTLFDDAMISMRYAWNFAQGNGLVWSLGEYVQGYTNLLWTLIMSIFASFLSKSSTVFSIQVLGIVLLVCNAFLTLFIFRLALSKKSPSISNIMAFVSVLLYYPIVYWTLLGMENGLTMLLILSGVYFLLKYELIFCRKYLFYLAFCFGLAYVSRPDSIIYAGVCYLYLLYIRYKKKLSFFNISWVLSLCLFIFPIICVLVFQYGYYGELLPNTYNLKVKGIPLFERVLNGILYTIGAFLVSIIVLFIFSSISLFKDFKRQKVLFFSLFLISIIYEIYVGGDPWLYWRKVSIAIPFLFLLCIDGLDRLSTLIPRFKKVFITLSFLSIFITINGRQFLMEMTLFVKPYDTSLAAANFITAKKLDEITKDGSSRAVTLAGVIPYYTNNQKIRFIDILGKCDRYIANLPPHIGDIYGFKIRIMPGHSNYDYSYSIKALQPTYTQSYGGSIRKYMQKNYVKVTYKDEQFILKKNSPNVLWDKVKIISHQF